MLSFHYSIIQSASYTAAGLGVKFQGINILLVHKKYTCIALVLIILIASYQAFTKLNTNPNFEIGEVIDSLDNVEVFYNGGVNHVRSRNLSVDGYNLGLSYQCVEFVKRYYYKHYKHQMPDSYGHAKHFFDKSIGNGQFSNKRGLYQYSNGHGDLPSKGDIVVYSPSLFNRYGHVSIVSMVDLENKKIEIIQQNPGPFKPSRETYPIVSNDGAYMVENNRIIGWLSLSGK